MQVSTIRSPNKTPWPSPTEARPVGFGRPWSGSVGFGQGVLSWGGRGLHQSDWVKFVYIGRYQGDTKYIMLGFLRNRFLSLVEGALLSCIAWMLEKTLAKCLHSSKGSDPLFSITLKSLILCLNDKLHIWLKFHGPSSSIFQDLRQGGTNPSPQMPLSCQK